VWLPESSPKEQGKKSIILSFFAGQENPPDNFHQKCSKIAFNSALFLIKNVL